MYQETREKTDNKEKINLDYSLCVPFHPREKRFIKILKEQFGISTVFKKTQTLGDILLKKGRQIKKEYKETLSTRYPAQSARRYMLARHLEHSRKEQEST